MARKHSYSNLLVLVLCVAGCADDPAVSGTTTPAESTAGAQASSANTGKPSTAGAAANNTAKAGGGGATATAGPGTSTAPSGAAGKSAGSATAGAVSSNAGAGAAGGGSGQQAGSSAPKSDAGAISAAGTGAAGVGATAAGTGAAGGASEATPEPVATPYVWGVGVGVSDVAAATKFYTEVMHMTLEKENVQRDDRVETVLASTKAGRGSRLVLMKYNDNREVRKISAKLVWQAPNPSAINSAAAMHPDYVSRLNIGIVQFDGPDTYIQEVGSSFDDGGAGIMEPYMVALGFSVSDQPKSLSFYEMGLGMEQSPLGTFTVTDATGRGSITEYTLQIPTGGGSALVPQAWSPMRNSKDNPIKIVLFVPDAQLVADKVMSAGGTIAQPAARSAAYDNRLLIVAKDPDGYLVELVQ
jgi:catechol 2,3-dioxygenase-like lactoylglutathione lyase family enzyme